MLTSDKYEEYGYNDLMDILEYAKLTTRILLNKKEDNEVYKIDPEKVFEIIKKVEDNK